MRAEIATRHVEHTELGWQLTPDQRLVGRIEWDPNSDARLPLVVIDCKPFTWEQVGHMLMTFEGFTLEARVKDTIEMLGAGTEQPPPVKPGCTRARRSPLRRNSSFHNSLLST